MTPGQNQQHYVAGALDLSTGTLHHCLGPRKINALFRDLLSRLGACYPTDRYTRLYVVVDNYTIHHATAVDQWLAAHARFTQLWPPMDYPAPIQLGGHLTMSMTAVPTIISANTSPISWLIWKTICT